MIEIDLDVLILGGGGQGLWLLNELDQLGYSTFLLTDKSLGTGQTLSSQVYIHQGYFYKSLELIQQLKEANFYWKNFINNYNISCPNHQPMFGFNQRDASTWSNRWKKVGLKFSEYQGELPSLFRDGELQKGLVYNTDEIWLNGEELIEKLTFPVKDLVGNGTVSNIKVENFTVKKIYATIDNKPVCFSSRYLVLAAGSGNQFLLNKVSECDNYIQNKVDNAQQLRKCQVLVLRGKELPDVTCLCPGFQIFIAHRKANDENVWLVTHGFDALLNFDPYLSLPISTQRLYLCLKQLIRLVPDILSMDLRWGIYTVLKAESREIGKGKRPNGGFIGNFGLNNLLASWPTKLTLVPVVSKKIAENICQAIPARKTQERKYYRNFSRLPIVLGTERWREVELFSWNEFQEKFVGNSEFLIHKMYNSRIKNCDFACVE